MTLRKLFFDVIKSPWVSGFRDTPRDFETKSTIYKVGDKVVVYDRFRFAIPLRAVVINLSESNDGVQLQMTESNNHNYPIGCTDVWVSRRQLRKDKESQQHAEKQGEQE